MHARRYRNFQNFYVNKENNLHGSTPQELGASIVVLDNSEKAAKEL